MFLKKFDFKQKIIIFLVVLLGMFMSSCTIAFANENDNDILLSSTNVEQPIFDKREDFGATSEYPYYAIFISKGQYGTDYFYFLSSSEFQYGFDNYITTKTLRSETGILYWRDYFSIKNDRFNSLNFNRAFKGFAGNQITFGDYEVLTANHVIKDFAGNVVFHPAPTDPEQPVSPDTSWMGQLVNVFWKILLVIIGGMILLTLFWLLLKRLLSWLKAFSRS